jgi:hypothetical protein
MFKFKSQKFNVLAMIGIALLIGLAGHYGLVQPEHSGIAFLGMGGILTNAGARMIDPILSNVAQGYKNSEFVGNYLFPRVPVQVSGGQIIEFGKEAFYSYNLRRSPGGVTKRIQFGYLGKPFALLQDSGEVPVPREWMRDASIVPGIDLGTRAINLGMKAILKSLETDQATIAINATNYDAAHKVALAGATKWSTATGTPSNDIDTAREAIRSAVGVYPNVVLMSAVAFNAARNNPNVTARFQYTTTDSISEEMLARLWNVDKVIVGKAITMTDAGVSSDIWGNNVVLAYTNLGSQNAEEPSYGYTYTMDGNPLVEQTYWDPATKSWVYPVNFERVPVLSGITSGYLIQTPA